MRDVQRFARDAQAFDIGRIVNNGTVSAPSYANSPTVLVSFNGSNGVRKFVEGCMAGRFH